MRIGKWTVRIEGWKLVFEPCWGKWPGDITDDGSHIWVNAGSPVDLNKWANLSSYYSAEDIKRWQEELRGHWGGW